jgi:hypothetical protein
VNLVAAPVPAELVIGGAPVPLFLYGTGRLATAAYDLLRLSGAANPPPLDPPPGDPPGNVLEILPAQWVQIQNAPSNVLIIPQRVPTNPLVPQAQNGAAKEYQTNTDGCSCCVIIAHDAVSGWWLEIADRCDPSGFPGSCCIEGVAPDGSHFDPVAGGFVLDLSTVSASLPAWASEQPVRFDAWGVVCCPVDVLIVVNPENPPPPPPGGFPSCPADQYAAPCKRGDFIDQLTGCCDPPLGAVVSPPKRELPLIPIPTRLPIPTNSIAVTACGCESTVSIEELT